MAVAARFSLPSLVLHLVLYCMSLNLHHIETSLVLADSPPQILAVIAQEVGAAPPLFEFERFPRTHQH